MKRFKMLSVFFVSIPYLVLILGIYSSQAFAGREDPDVFRRHFGSFYGTIAVHGCRVSANELLIRARPVYPPNPVVPTEDGRRSDVEHTDNHRSLVARPRPLTSGEFRFDFKQLSQQTPYRLGIKLLGQSLKRCEKLVWNVSRDPLIMAGDEALTFDAYAVTSRLEVLGEIGPGREEAKWVSADVLDFDNPEAAVRQFKWRSLDREVTGGELQVSTVPFPNVGQRNFNTCSEDKSKIVFKRGFFATPNRWSTISVDFYSIVHGRGRTPTDTGVDTTRLDANAVDTSLIDANTLDKLELGHPLYVRVVPTINGEPACDPGRGVPAEVRMAKLLKDLIDKLGQPQFSIGTKWYDKPVILSGPQPGETCYRVTKEHVIKSTLFDQHPDKDKGWDLLVSTKFGLSVGDKVKPKYPDYFFCVSNSSGGGWVESFVNTFGDVLTGIVDSVGKLVNSASELWEDIQKYAVDAAAAGLSAIPGVNCSSICKAALQAGLEIGLATMGVPPSLPNFDELLDQGADYLVAQVAAQAASQAGLGGIPDVLTDYVSKESQQFIKQAVQDMKDRPYGMAKLPDWLVLDIGFVPARLTMEIFGTGLKFPYRVGMIRSNDPIYAGKFVRLPGNLPGPSEQPLIFPMVLEPNLYNLPSAPSYCSPSKFAKLKTLFGEAGAHKLCDYTEYEGAVWDKNQWVSKLYKNGCYHLMLTGLSPIGDHIFPVADQWFTTEGAQPCVTIKLE